MNWFKAILVNYKANLGLGLGNFGPLDLKKITVVYAVVFPSYILAFICNELSEVRILLCWGVGWVKKWSAWGILCHCQLLSKISCFIRARDNSVIVYTKLFAPLFLSLFPCRSLKTKTEELDFSVWKIFKWDYLGLIFRRTWLLSLLLN